MRLRAQSAVLALGLISIANSARAGETTMAEPVIEENISDIDGREYPTFEMDLTPAAFRSTRTNAGFWHTGLEAEWRPFDRAGVGVEIDSAGSLDGVKPTGAVHFVPRGALSYVFFRDFERNVYLQAEVAGRYDDGSSLALVDPTEFAQPLWAGVREAMKLGPLEARAGVFVEAGGTAAHAPTKMSGALLYSLVGASTRGAVGAEVVADWSRRSPFALAPEAQVMASVFDLPVRLEVAVPFTVGARADDAAIGLAFRFVLEPKE